MGVQTQVRDSIRAAFRQMGDLVTDMTYTEFGTPVNDEDTATITSPETPHAIKAVPIDYKASEYVGLIQEGDERVFLENFDLNFTPKTGDTVTFRGRTLRIVHPWEYFAGDQVAYWELQLRM
jgi:hypothetical protein